MNKIKTTIYPAYNCYYCIEWIMHVLTTHEKLVNFYVMVLVTFQTVKNTNVHYKCTPPIVTYIF